MSVTKANIEAWRFVEQNTQKVSGPESLELNSNDVIVIARARNAQPYVAPFINHYLKLGVKHFFLLDNGSSDDTSELARQWDQVTILQTHLPYKEYKMDFLHFLLNRFGCHCWSIVVDMDEFFDYPFSGLITLPELIQYLDKHQYQAVVGQMLDMFPAELSFGSSSNATQNFISNQIYYDLSDISKHLYHESIQQNEWSNYNIFLHRGIRKRLFGLSDIILSKFPLIRYSPNWKWESIHCLSGAKIADFSTVIYHYKFRDDFLNVVEDAVKEQQYNRDSHAYKKILSGIKEGQIPSKLPPGTQRAPTTNDLVRHFFLVLSANYFQYAAKLARKQIMETKHSISQSTKKLLNLQSDLLDLAIQQNAQANQELALSRKSKHEEVHRETALLKNTLTWKIGTAIVKPIKKVAQCLSFWKG